MWVNGETTHVGPDWCLRMLFRMLSFRPEAPSHHPHVQVTTQTGPARTNQRMRQTNPAVTLKIGGNKRGQYLTVILHSLYEEHAVRLLLFLWCRAAPVSDFDLKDFIENGISSPSKQELMSAGRINTKLRDWRQARNMRDWEHFYPPPPIHARNQEQTSCLQEWFSLTRNDQ